MASKLKAALIPNCVGHYCALPIFDILTMGVCITRQLQTSGRGMAVIARARRISKRVVEKDVTCEFQADRNILQ